MQVIQQARRVSMNAATLAAITDSYDEFRRWQLWFPAAIVIIAAVSMYDTYLIIRFKDMIYMMESNPMGRWLLEIGHGEVGVFVRVKLAGTLLVLSLLFFMKIRQFRLLFPVTTSVASCQTCLMIYLTAL